jgi:hypothetical protein
MRTRATFTADTYDKACELATEAFKDFFGDHPWRFTSESAEAETAVLDCAGHTTVLSWATTFEAETTYR